MKVGAEFKLLERRQNHRYNRRKTKVAWEISVWDRRMENGNLASIKEIFRAMDKLANRPFEYFVSGIGFILVLIGLLGQPWKNLTQEELWAISIFGGISLISGLIVAIKKADYTMRTNLEKINYKKFVMTEKTKRLELVQNNNGEENLSDLETF